jgi:hypothetical protein
MHLFPNGTEFCEHRDEPWSSVRSLEAAQQSLNGYTGLTVIRSSIASIRRHRARNAVVVTKGSKMYVSLEVPFTDEWVRMTERVIRVSVPWIRYSPYSRPVYLQASPQSTGTAFNCRSLHLTSTRIPHTCLVHEFPVSQVRRFLPVRIRPVRHWCFCRLHRCSYISPKCEEFAQRREL